MNNFNTPVLSNSLKHFLNSLIDYAGLFPPAGLKLEDAFINYLNYLKSDFNFALSGFIIPVSRLEEFAPLIKSSEFPESPVKLSLLTTSGKSLSESKDKIQKDILYCKNFLEEFSGSVLLNAFEVKMPDEIFDHTSPDQCNEFISYVTENLNKLSDEAPVVFFESIQGTDWKKNFSSVIDAVYENNQGKYKSGFKLRTGGLIPEAFPDSNQIAFCIRKCLDSKVPMKFTAGLHHPFRHFDKSIGTKMHGFVNVFGAGITAMRHDISDEGIAEMLEDENPANFKFTDDFFSWKEWETECDDIDFTRRELVISYGSCSFDEPLDDLKSLNLIK